MQFGKLTKPSDGEPSEALTLSSWCYLKKNAIKLILQLISNHKTKQFQQKLPWFDAQVQQIKLTFLPASLNVHFRDANRIGF